MTLAPATDTPVAPAAPRGARAPVGARSRAAIRPATVLAGCLLGVAALVADAASGEARLALVGLVAMAVALAMTLTQAVRSQVGRPWRTSRLAARAGRAACVFVAASLASVGGLERMGPQVTQSAVFAAGVAVLSVVLLVVLPLALVVFGGCVLQDRRLGGCVRVLPWTLLLVVAAAVVALAVTDGGLELWLHAAAVAAAGAALVGFSAGVSRIGHR